MEIMDAIRRAFGPKIDPQQLLGIIAIRLEPTDPFGNLFPGTTWCREFGQVFSVENRRGDAWSCSTSSAGA